MLLALQSRAFKWVLNTFGARVAYDLKERAARVAEEAIELAQAEGVSVDMVKAIVDRVYSRPPGDIKQEIAGVQFTLAIHALPHDVDPTEEFAKVLARVEGMPVEHFHNKHREKTKAGTTIQESI